MKITREAIEAKPYSIGELAKLYNVSLRTMNNWLAPHKEAIGQRSGRFFTVKQVLLIFQLIDLPCKVED